jgi:hypothetical protein
MAGSVGVVSRKPASPALAAAKRFGRYKSENEKAHRDATIVESEAMKRIRANWMSWREVPRKNGSLYFKDIPEGIGDLRPNGDEINAFCAFLERFQFENDFPAKAGFFLSFLINRMMGDSFRIDTAQFDVILDGIGGHNKKKITIIGESGHFLGGGSRGGSIDAKGDVGDAAGFRLVEGSISVEGDVEDFLGWDMKGGQMIIQGKAGNSIGYHMRGGRITVLGDAGESIGKEMTGGEIRLEGEHLGLSDEK